MANGPLGLNKGFMPHILMDSWNNSENPSLKGHRVSNGFNEHLFRFHSLALESKRKGPEHRSALCMCQLFPIRPTGRAAWAPPARCHLGDGWALGRAGRRFGAPSLPIAAIFLGALLCFVGYRWLLNLLNPQPLL